MNDEADKRFRSMQKTLRDIDKLRKKDNLDKLQKEKLVKEGGLIEELTAIRAKADETVLERKKKMAEYGKKAEKSEPKVKKPPRSEDAPDWMCNECGATGKVDKLEGSEGAVACPKCGGESITHYAPGRDDSSSDEDPAAAAAAQAATEAKKSMKHTSTDLKTARQKKASSSAKAAQEEGIPSPSSAKWQEVREVLESGDGGVDKGRQKKAIEVRRPKEGGPYKSFDQTLLRCSFLTRVELKLAPGVLSGEDFNLYFPGGLADGLMELVLKENQLPMVPPGIQQLQRLKCLDLSTNCIESLPDEETWEGCCATLEMIDLSFNKLTSIAQLASLRKLSQLKVDANLLTSLEGVSWGELKQIVNISAVGNQITAISEDIGKAPSLEYVELSENKITTVPVSICELKKLKGFNIAGNPIKDPKTMKAAEKGVKDLKTYVEKVGAPKGKKR